MTENIYVRYLGPPTALFAVLISCGYLALYHWIPGGAEIPLSRVLGYFAGGFLSWTLLEYFLHRFVFHDSHLPKIPEDWHKHLVHHAQPQSPKEIIATFQNSTLIALALFFALWGATRSLAFGLLWMPGMIVGYLFYEWVHFIIHHTNPKNSFLKSYFAYHLYHHHKNPRRHFGVTSPFWDLIFRTR